MNNMRDLIDEVKNRCDIVNVISQYINLKIQGVIIVVYVHFIMKKQVHFT